MAGYRLEDFSVGDSYDVDHDGAVQPLELIKAEVLPGSSREGGAFRLEFRGPFEPILPQATHALRGEGGDARDIFIVPIGREPEGTRYEAVFY
jgi:hypothetical protein